MSGLERDSWNQGWSLEVWFITRSAITRIPRWWAASMNWRDVLDRAVVGVDRVEVGDVVAAVAQRRGVERQQPDAVDPEPLQVVELLGQPAEVARAVAVAVEEAADVDLVEDRALEPQRVGLEPLARLREARRRSGGASPRPAVARRARAASRSARGRSRGLHRAGRAPGGRPGRGARSCARAATRSARRPAGRGR